MNERKKSKNGAEQKSAETFGRLFSALKTAKRTSEVKERFFISAGIDDFVERDDKTDLYGDVLFVVFNTTNINFFESHALAEKAIEANKDAKWRVALFHHDIYGTGHHACDDDNYLLQGVFSAILDKFEFDLAFD